MRGVRFTAAAGLLAVLVSLGGVAGAGGQEKNERLTLGVLRSDGVLLPFAAFDGRNWSTPWPTAIAVAGGEGAKVPANLAAVPPRWWGRDVPTEWRLFPIDDAASPTPFKPLGPVVTAVGRSRRVGIITDHPVGQLNVRPLEFPFPKAGLAVGGSAAVQRIAIVSRSAPAAAQLLERLRPDIETAENNTIRSLGAGTGWSHPYPREARAKIAPALEAWYATVLPDTKASVYYVELVKKYPPQPGDRGCGLETFVSGWVHTRSDKPELESGLKAVVTYCDRDKVSYMLPLGELRVRDRSHWVFQMSGQNHEWYVVVEVGPGRVRYVAEYPAGSLPLP